MIKNFKFFCRYCQTNRREKKEFEFVKKVRGGFAVLRCKNCSRLISRRIEVHNPVSQAGYNHARGAPMLMGAPLLRTA